jgi:type IV fimbrial biogenesis protein FimT
MKRFPLSLATAVPPQGGFSLVEMMIVVVIVGILAVSGISWGKDYVANNRVRAAAESLRSALMLARDEAIKRNRPVSMVFDGAQQQWSVVEGATVPLPGVVPTLVGAPIRVGSYRDTREVEFAQNGQVITNSRAITFTPLGQANVIATQTFEVKSNAAGVSCQPTGKIRCLNVRLLTGGQATMCDPSMTYASDPRGC